MKTLFDKTTLGHRTLKNRVWRSATWMALADAEGNVTDSCRTLLLPEQVLCKQSGIAERISPLLNHRTDRYGGDQRGRSRILYEILKDMRSKTSPDFLITMKINSTDEYPGGLTTQDFMLTSRLMADAGIDAIEVSANGTSRTSIRAGQNEGYSRAAAMALAAYVDTPVVLVGGLRSIEKINQFLNDTKIEYVSLSRPLIREPNLINRWQVGDTAPSKCVSCNSCYRTPGHQCIFNLRNKDLEMV